MEGEQAAAAAGGSGGNAAAAETMADAAQTEPVEAAKGHHVCSSGQAEPSKDMPRASAVAAVPEAPHSSAAPAAAADAATATTAVASIAPGGAVEGPGLEPPAAKPKVVIVTGPTAVGKTAISLLLAQRLGPQGAGGNGGGTGGGGGDNISGRIWGEVISADSVQVYRGLDVGSDKLPKSERQGVSHHMIDVRDPLEDFSAGEFFEGARPVARDIIQRGGVPLVVGGTGLYLRWFVVGKGGAPAATPEAEAAVEEALKAAWTEAAEAKAPKNKGCGEAAAAAEDCGTTKAKPGCGDQPGDAVAGDGAAGPSPAATVSAKAPETDAEATGPEVTAEPEAEAAAAADDLLTVDEKWEAAAALLTKWGDEAAYSRIRAERNNYYRLKRALAILAMHPGARLADFEPGADPDRPQDLDFRCFFLHRPRLQLYDRIALRVEEMVVGGGLLEEAAMLLRLGLLPGENMAGRAIGYRQAMEWLVAARSAGRRVGLADLCALHASICQATHKLVRNQMTWFRDDPMYKWVDVEGRDPRDVVEELLQELAKPQHEGGCGDSGRLSKQEQKAIMRYKPALKLLTEAAATGAAAAAAAAAANTVTAAAVTTTDGPVERPEQQKRPPKPKSKAALAAEAAAAAAAKAEAQLAPLLTRVNEVLLPGISDKVVAAAAGAATGKKEAAGAEAEEGLAAGAGSTAGRASAEGCDGRGGAEAEAARDATEASPGEPDAKRPRPRPHKL